MMRTIPAQQRLKAHNGTGCQADLGLVAGADLIIANYLPCVIKLRRTLFGLIHHLWIKHVHAAPAAVLEFV
ncbi:hypothetical protein D3C72_1701590 [compost metagenome]